VTLYKVTRHHTLHAYIPPLMLSKPVSPGDHGLAVLQSCNLAILQSCSPTIAGCRLPDNGCRKYTTLLKNVKDLAKIKPDYIS